jgi:nickel-type superoxide dismutase maturation protease
VTQETYHRGRRWVIAAAASASVAVVITWHILRRRPFRVAIEGESMVPTLLPGDWALAAAGVRVSRGDVVVVEHPDRPGYEMVKRLIALPGDGVGGDRLLGRDEYWIEGDRRDASTDSRQFGPVRRDELRAKVLLIYWPPPRRRLL